MRLETTPLDSAHLSVRTVDDDGEGGELVGGGFFMKYAAERKEW